VDSTRDYARVSHRRQWSNYNIDNEATDLLLYLFGNCCVFYVVLNPMTPPHTEGNYDYIWSSTIGLFSDGSEREVATIYLTPWNRHLYYVCQYHSKYTNSAENLSVYQSDYNTN